ncbi:energy-coupling factor ABC transporter ATP-binding protein [Paenibacillus sp. N3/727]|uniref:ABC transporter ATP-binding protein n=1 Tax=Paenibacillus sp. N3/727 TaxID=2925845 RepID=UPI001F52D619|nr:ABC transporter ATP-binding protein [Paenibacillus sp. N3/727]UNK21397.1 energy-coupling factor ABC transporter ATP-binding protein [Paenibacillus sp. N3/727]
MVPSHSLYVEGLRLKFPGEDRLVFKDLSFAAQKGEKVLLLGPSGCGKSTLLQVLSGMIPHAIEVPMKCSDQRIPSSWAYVFQDPDTQFCMPYVDEELAFVLENLCVPQEEMIGRMQEVLSSVGLRLENLHIPISHLSQGMKQRLALASALLLQPEVLFLDEPSALLDPEGREQIWEAVKSVSDGRTLIIVEHRIEEMAAYVDRVVLFGPDGVILGQGSPEVVFTAFQKELTEYGIWYPGVWDDYAGSPTGAETFRSLTSVTVRTELCEDIDVEGLCVVSAAHIRELSTNSGSGNISGITGWHGGEQEQFHVGVVNQDPVLELSDFTVLRKGQPVVAVDKATVYPGEFAAVIGPNGAGKSSLLLGLMGLLRAEGEYRLGGDIVPPGKKRKERKLRQGMLGRIGFVFQNPELQFVTERVLDEVAYSLLVDGIPLEEAELVARDALKRFGLSGLEQRHPYQLSTGQKRRLSVATAMAREPEVLLLDEPTFGQDARNTFSILEMCEELRQAGTAILMVTHEMQIAQQAATHIWEVQKGKIISQQASSRLKASPIGENRSAQIPGERSLILSGVSR